MGDKKKILIIDDEPMILELLQKMLETKFDVEKVNSAAKAIHFLNSAKADCILLDITMPNISGFDFLNDIRRIPSYFDVPIIIVSGNTGEEFFTQAKNSSAYAVISKPVKKDLLIQTIEKAINS